VLAAAGAAALGGLAAVLVGVATDPVVRDCAGALDAAAAANSALMDSYSPMIRAETRARHVDDEAAGLSEARLMVEQRRLELEAAGVAVTRLCHYSPDPVVAR
jgi:hypothetical protein